MQTKHSLSTATNSENVALVAKGLNKTVPAFRVPDDVYEVIEYWVKKDRRTITEVSRALMERGAAASRKDKQLFEPPEDERCPRVVPLHLKGRISAGKPIETIDDAETIYVFESDIAGTRNAHALRVVGDSMKDANIQDGDIIIVADPPAEPQNQIVVAYIREGIDRKATLKRWHQSGNKVELKPENEDYETVRIPRKKVEPYAVLVKVIRTIDLPKVAVAEDAA